jgi:hypothetical protein
VLTTLPTDAIDALIAFASGRTSPSTFERWLYVQPWLDSGLLRNEYLHLVGAEFRTPEGVRLAREAAMRVLRDRIAELRAEPDESLLWALPTRLRAISLGVAEGTRDHLWTTADACAVIATLAESRWLILGMDGWLSSGPTFVPSYSNWAFSGVPSEPYSLAVSRAGVEAVQFIQHHAVASTAFSVVARRPGAGEV